ncbi:MAG: tRNA1(Val) (adenine(37)-N6)-methyltransferase [Thermodesulfovibrionales bacterium]|nr:tRNA1(Val) (adenine(37)-N6)-methyltransferase [Thermodesulfovibrionales bacterium]
MMLTLDSIRDIKIFQSKRGYRFSVDSLLVFSFVNTRHAKKIADLGAGSGIIGILLAKKYSKSRVYLVELQKSLYENCLKNIEINGLQDRVMALNEDIRLIAKGKTIAGLEENTFDIIVSNPPFRPPDTGRISPEDERALARHEISLKLEDLLKASQRLLKTGGRLYLIYLPERLVELLIKLRISGLEPKRLRPVHSKINESARMILVEAAKGRRQGLTIEKPFIIYNEHGVYTEEMKNILK